MYHNTTVCTLQFKKKKPLQLPASYFLFAHRNADGYIDRDEFAEIIRSTGESITEEEIDELLKEGDKNADGMLDFDGKTPFMSHYAFVKSRMSVL